jgi:hypothetical protein
VYLRVLINFLPDATHYFSPLVQTICIITLIYASFSTIVQQDTKRLIAYSSVCHMAIVVLGLFSNSVQGIEGAILLSIAHGFVSPALFICVGGIVYERTHTRIIQNIRGLVLTMPVFTIMFFMFTLANTGLPLSLNWLGEIMALMGVWNINPITAVFGATGIVLSATYSLFLYNRISYGSYHPSLLPLKDINRREFFLLLSLLIPTFLLGIFPNVILDTLHISVSSLLYEIPFNPYDAEELGSLAPAFTSSVFLKPQNLNPYTKKIMNNVSDEDFYEFLRGLTDSEGNFYISVDNRNSNANFANMFRISLHKDDRALLEYICNRLKLGTVFPKNISTVNSNKGKKGSSRASSTFTIKNIAEVFKLIDIFDKCPLNTRKQLDYENWRKAFFKNLEYSKTPKSEKEKKEKLGKEIKNIKSKMNNNKKPSEINTNPFKITFYWLLGFIEGDGCFNMQKYKLSHYFSLTQIFTEEKLLLAIKSFLEKLPGVEKLPKKNYIGLSIKPARKNTKPQVVLYFRDFSYISSVFIPFLDQLVFFSKKGKDYIDWKILSLLKLEKKHLIPEGKELTKIICNRMNKNRLSTNKKSLNLLTDNEMKIIDKRIKNLLNKPSLFQEIWVYDKDQLVPGSPFTIFKHACDSVGIGRVKEGKKIIDSGKLVKKRFSFYSSCLSNSTNSNIQIAPSKSTRSSIRTAARKK